LRTFATCWSAATTFFRASGFFFSGFGLRGGGGRFSSLLTVFRTDAKLCLGGGFGFDFGRGNSFLARFFGFGSGFFFSTFGFGLGFGFISTFAGFGFGAGTASGSGMDAICGSGGAGGVSRLGGDGGGGDGSRLGSGFALGFGFSGSSSVAISTSMTCSGTIIGRDEGRTPNQAMTKTEA
jgi:hypothetical protein